MGYILQTMLQSDWIERYAYLCSFWFLFCWILNSTSFKFRIKQTFYFKHWILTYLMTSDIYKYDVKTKVDYTGFGCFIPVDKIHYLSLCDLTILCLIFNFNVLFVIICLQDKTRCNLLSNSYFIRIKLESSSGIFYFNYKFFISKNKCVAYPLGLSMV
jgi:hypothetical protein